MPERSGHRDYGASPTPHQPDPARLPSAQQHAGHDTLPCALARARAVARFSSMVQRGPPRRSWSRALDSGEEVGGIGGADFLRLPIVAKRLADGLEGRGAGLLADLLGEEFCELCAWSADDLVQWHTAPVRCAVLIVR